MKTDWSVNSKREFGEVKRIVVKVGSGVIAGKGRFRPKVISILAQDVTALRKQGYEIVMVVSGAVAAGFRSLALAKPPSAVVLRQAAASVGQHRLMATFAREFGKHRTPIAQLLMSAEDIENRRRFLSARHTLQMLLNHGVVPIINENDALSDDEAKVGDNDHLAALLTSVASADLLILLSHVRGLYHDETDEVIPQIDTGSDVDRHITSAIGESGVGGMKAKVSAARLAGQWGVSTIIAEGTKAETLLEVISGKPVGTWFVSSGRKKLNSRKQWIAVRTRSLGAVRVDVGAQKAIVEKGASLLPSGILEVEGDFSIGARVDVQDASGASFAVGLVSYPADEIRRVCGRRAADIKTVLGYVYVDEIIHRDDMVLLN
ncbi:MAG: glutamate 5-kinase [Phycisphaerales bacterium]|nr:glutamate 5-kinase [Phycisphaerales bacterium]